MDPSGAEADVSLPFADICGKVAALFLGTQECEELKLAVELVNRGCRVVLVGCPLARVHEAWNQACEQSAAYGPDWVKTVELDATEGHQAIEEAIEEAWRAFLSIDILVNCALDLAGEKVKTVTVTTENDFDKITTVNVKAIWSVSQAVAKKMQQGERGGSVLFLTSISGTVRGIFPGVSMYGTSMAAINHLTKMMAMELGKFGIRVNAIACGLAEADNYFEESAVKISLQSLANNVVPLRRWLNFSNDVTGVVLWLAGDSSTFVTGTVTIVDGGLSLRRPRMGEYRNRLLSDYSTCSFLRIAQHPLPHLFSQRQMSPFLSVYLSLHLFLLLPLIHE